MALTGRAKSRARRAASKARKKSSSSSSGSSSGGSKETVAETYAKGVKALGYDPRDRKTSRRSDRETVAETYARGQRALSPESFRDEDIVTLPKPPVDYTDFGSILDIGNAGLTDREGGLTYEGGQFVYNPAESPAVNAAREANQSQQGVLAAVQEYLQPDPQQYERAYADTLEESGLREAERLRDRYSAQLNAITAKRDADILGLEGQGRGITETIIGGQQARINRDAAIQALPVQAQLAAAQGQVDTAQRHLDTLFQVRSQDIAANNAFKTNMATAVMSYASEAQRNILNARMSDINAAAAKEQANLAQIQEWSKMAVQSGQSELIPAFTALDPKSETFAQDFGALQGQVRDTTAELQRESLRASTYNSYLGAQQKEMEIEMFQQAQIDRQNAIESGQLLPEQAEVVDGIDNQFRSEPIVKEYNTAIAKRYAVNEILENGVSGVQDLLLVYEFMKSVDPTSVVRESEFDNAAKSGNIFAGQYTKFNKGYFGEGGVLPESVKDSFTSSLNASFEGKVRQYNVVKQQFGEKVNRRIGVTNGAQYLTAYEQAAPLTAVEFGIGNSMAEATEEEAGEILFLMNNLLTTPSGEIGR